MISDLEINSAVFTVPPSFNQRQINSIMTAAILAGINVQKIIRDDVAVYYQHKYTFSKSIDTVTLIADLGANFFNCSIIDSIEKANSKNTSEKGVNVGGRDFDHVIYKWICIAEPKDEGKVMLIKESERIKIKLSENELVK